MVDAAVDGMGIAYVPENLIVEALKAGQLIQVLDAWSLIFSGYHLYYPNRRQNSPAFSLVVAALRETH